MKHWIYKWLSLFCPKIPFFFRRVPTPLAVGFGTNEHLFTHAFSPRGKTARVWYEICERDRRKTDFSSLVSIFAIFRELLHLKYSSFSDLLLHHTVISHSATITADVTFKQSQLLWKFIAAILQAWTAVQKKTPQKSINLNWLCHTN